MSNPRKGLYSVILKSLLSLLLRTPTGRRQISWLFTKRGEFVPGITEKKIPSAVRFGDSNPDHLHSNPRP